MNGCSPGYCNIEIDYGKRKTKAQTHDKSSRKCDLAMQCYLFIHLFIHSFVRLFVCLFVYLISPRQQNSLGRETTMV